MKYYLIAIYQMLTFQSVTDMPRLLEIGHGLLGWFNIGLVLYCQYKIWF